MENVAAPTNPVAQVFIAHKIVPEVLDAAPEEILKVKYEFAEVNLGNELCPSQSINQPVLLTWKADPNKLYLLCMIDPDAPSRRIHLLREVNHWLIGNIPGNEIEKGEVLAGYIPCGPPKATGLHRYIFLVFEQPGKLTFEDGKVNGNGPNLTQRIHFHIREFAKKYGLGAPIAGNFFLAGATAGSCTVM